MRVRGSELSILLPLSLSHSGGVVPHGCDHENDANWLAVKKIIFLKIIF
jgi:hypothetical protein